MSGLASTLLAGLVVALAVLGLLAYRLATTLAALARWLTGHHR